MSRATSRRARSILPFTPPIEPAGDRQIRVFELTVYPSDAVTTVRLVCELPDDAVEEFRMHILKHAVNSG